MNEFFSKYKKIIIFGAGPIVDKLLDSVNLQIQYIIDNDPRKWGKKLSGIKIFNPDVLKTEDKNELVIIITSFFYDEEIRNQLSEMGFKRYENYFSIDEIYPIGKTRAAHHPELLQNENIVLLKSVSDGRVMIDKKELKVYRGFYKNAAAEYKEVFDNCLELKLFNDYLVNLNISNIENIHPFGIVFEQDYIRPITDSNEWSPLMMIDAANRTIDLQILLSKRNLTIHDPLPPNIIYDNTYKWLDFGSIWNIDKITNTKEPVFWNVDQFFYCEHPISTFFEEIVINCKKNKESFDKNKINNNIFGFLSEAERKKYINIRQRIFNKCIENKFAEAFAIIKDYFNEFTIEVDLNLISYYEEMFHYPNLTKEDYIVLDMIDKICSDTMVLIDLGRLYNKKSVKLFKKLDDKIKKIIVTSNSSVFNDCIYTILQKNSIYNILPIQAQLFKHQSIHAPNNHQDFCDRYRTSTLLALNTIQELVFCQQFSFEEIFEKYSRLTDKYLIFDFDDKCNVILYSGIEQNEYEWYTYEELLKAHNKYFNLHQIISVTDSKKIILSKRK
ncbi:hypothetical protein SAMN05660297_00707 [Natronincola peptidivorans]|uniref:Uncharacterized protein n=1 Tax=Natronincola peptidivorans TaxID=426128 RepID=A0A1H9ZVB0_9FIRM|nr:hypothetical protein [Natronincola peptidivorans]SES84778.1 hypothetical protein SAMN05660297_00707 [Natronincola peptidivorans]